MVVIALDRVKFESGVLENRLWRLVRHLERVSEREFMRLVVS